MMTKKFIPQELIRKKRNGDNLEQDEIEFIVTGITENTLSEGQVAAFGMATYFQGLSLDEKVHLTRAMKNSGKVINWQDLNLSGPILDKHSTGGVGDKVSLMLAPIIAACGGFCPMITGRGLGHTGGTADKLESIPGYNISPSFDNFQNIVQELGCAIIGSTGDFAPADKRFYSIRDVTACVESIDLITTSILSKKMAAGLDGLVMDVKFGSGAFMDTFGDASNLAKSIIDVAKKSGLSISALLTDMNENLGKTAGNAVEVHEAIDFLKNLRVEPRLYEVTVSLCSELLILGKIVDTQEEAESKIKTVIENGKAAETFQKMTVALGGPSDLIDKPERYLPDTPIMKPVFSKESGYINAINTREIGLCIIEMGGGRRHASDTIRYDVGFSQISGIGEKIDNKKPLCYIHAANEDQASEISKKIVNIFEIKDTPPVKGPVVAQWIG